MLLVPMQNTWQRDIFHQLFERNPYSLCVHANTFSRIADTEHTHSLAGDETPFPQALQGVAATVVLGNHAQASGAAVHGI